MADQADQVQTRRDSRSWQIAVGAFVALGCLVTLGYTIVETFWG
jgi:hypothetical protein